MLACSALKLDFCPYSSALALQRPRAGQKERRAVLGHYGSETITDGLASGFDFYNARQAIEAGGERRTADPERPIT
jgi:hypothetical protein